MPSRKLFGFEILSLDIESRLTSFISELKTKSVLVLVSVVSDGSLAKGLGFRVTWAIPKLLAITVKLRAKSS